MLSFHIQNSPMRWQANIFGNLHHFLTATGAPPPPHVPALGSVQHTAHTFQIGRTRSGDEWNFTGRGQLKCDGTHAETRFRLSAKRTSPFKSAGGRQFSRLLAAEVCAISGSNAGYTMFRGSVKGTCYPLHSPVHLNRPGDVSSVDCWQPRCAHQR